jgi:5-methyltetrahydrofolate--homocysteine methyltransferase
MGTRYDNIVMQLMDMTLKRGEWLQLIVIGEKINGAIPSVKQAIEDRDEEFVGDLAVRDSEAGADYIDVCAATDPEVEIETLKWLMSVVQKAVDRPLCIDSPNPRTIAAVLRYADKPGIINSVSGEADKCEVIYPLIQGSEWQVIALAYDRGGISANVQAKLNIIKLLVDKAQKHDIALDRIHIDPLVLALSTDHQSLLKFVKTVTTVKKLYPTIKVTSGLSNISLGMPLRKAINHNFLTLAINAGIDSAIMDPCDRDMMTTLLATEALLMHDRQCKIYTTAFRTGKIGFKPISNILFP